MGQVGHEVIGSVADLGQKARGQREQGRHLTGSTELLRAGAHQD